MPHWQLPLRKAAVWPAGLRVPGPHLERIKQVQFPRQVSGCQLLQAADEVTVDVVGMILVLGEGTVRVNFPDADRPQLPRQDLKVGDQLRSPGRIPILGTPWIARDQDRLPEFL